MASIERCHCGVEAPIRGDGDPFEGRLDGYCDECAWARCDAYPDGCPRIYAACPECGRTFKRGLSMSAHRHKGHGVIGDRIGLM